MSDKLTPDELKHYRTFSIWHSADIGHKLLAHIAAVEAERDEAAALLREVAQATRWSITDRCMFCGTATDMHEPECAIKRIRAWLAKQETP
jgi:hypothetical protein